MKNFLITLLVTLSQITIAHATQWPDFPILYATGSAEKEIPPNLVTITFYVGAYDENPEKALGIVQKQSLEIINFYQELGLIREGLETYDIDKTAVREEKDYTELKILGYEVKQKFSITLPDLDRYTVLLDKLLKITNVSDIDSKFDVAQRKEIEATLMAEACANAQVDAENMANGMGTTLDSPYAISESNFHGFEDFFGISNPSSRMFKKANHADGDTAKITFIPSRIKIEKHVNVIYKLTSR
jgi:uncharacterized protein YggE